MGKNDVEWNEEAVYDERIAPLMTQIISICKEHRIPMVAQFVYGNTEEEALLCTTSLPAAAFDREDGGQSGRMTRTAMERGLSALTITIEPARKVING